MSDEIHRSRYHLALSVDIDRFSDREIRKRYLSSFVASGQATTVDEVRAFCRDARAAGLHVFPPCDHTDSRGLCLGHPEEGTADPRTAGSRSERGSIAAVRRRVVARMVASLQRGVIARVRSIEALRDVGAP